jgi:pyruvate,orthophosphate dikinase
MRREDLANALDRIAAGRLDPSDLLAEFTDADVLQLLQPRFVDTAANQWLATGQRRGSGDVPGILVLDREAAERLALAGVPYVYAVRNADASHFMAIKHCRGFFTSNPSPTAFGPVQAVSEGRPTLVGVPYDQREDQTRGPLTLSGGDSTVVVEDQPRRSLVFARQEGEPAEIQEGQWVSLSGLTGELYRGRLRAVVSPVARMHELLMEIWRSGAARERPADPGRALRRLGACPAYRELEPELRELLGLPLVRGYQLLVERALDLADLGVLVTAHTAEAVARARLLTARLRSDGGTVEVEPGSVGVGLLRDERMWSDPGELDLLRLVYLGSKVLGEQRFAHVRRRYLDGHGSALREVLAAAGGCPVTVRTLCMPYAKIFPDGFDAAGFAARHGLPARAVAGAVAEMSGEQEVYQGCRGMRLLCQRPDIAELWLTAVLGAAHDLAESGTPVRLRLLLATVTLPEEARFFLALFDRIAPALLGERLEEVVAGVSIMVETSGAYLALEDFLVQDGRHARIDGGMFGSNDFTAACLSVNREDSARTIIPGYVQGGILPHSPFEHLQESLVGRAIVTALRRARRTSRRHARPQLWGLGGELAADWQSVQWLATNAEPLGLRYVTTAPESLLVALIAAAQAALPLEHHSEVNVA